MVYTFWVCQKGGILRFPFGSEASRQAKLAGLPQIPDSMLRRVTLMSAHGRREWAARQKGIDP